MHLHSLTMNVVALAVALMPVTPVLPAGPLPVQAVVHGGCGTLARAVRRELARFLQRQGEFSASPRRSSYDALRGERDVDLHSCGRTAAVASVAFGDAMAGFNLVVAWNDSVYGRAANTCASHFLHQCTPVPGTPVSPAQRILIGNAWQAVAVALVDWMPFGDTSDISYFAAPQLEATLAMRLDAIADPVPGADSAVYP